MHTLKKREDMEKGEAREVADSFLCLPAALQVVWGRSVCGAFVVFQPINPLHIFNLVRCAAGEEH